MAPKPRIPPLPREPLPAQGLNLSGHACTPDALLTTVQCAAYLNCSPLSLCDWRVKKIGPPWISVGRCIRYRRSSVDQWLASRTQKGD
jgi:predicted DNA-binding transcriptional regulator AlpA